LVVTGVRDRQEGGEVAVYTMGTWIVKPGREAEFVRRWEEMGVWTTGRFAGARGTLLRDREEPNRFVSFGPWKSAEQIGEWRSDPEFAEHVARIRETVEAFDPHTLDLVVEVG
jgi:heme-degrading monooxygenase HmoA